MSEVSYTPPVALLLGYGSTLERSDWPDYRAELGFTAVHIPELARMINDPDLYLLEDDSAESWAPVHAWRALAQLGSPEAVIPMMNLIEAWASTLALFEFPKVMASIGPGAIPALATILADRARTDTARGSAIDGLSAIASGHPEGRASCIALISEQLREPRQNSIELNATLVKALCDLHSREAFPVIEAAFLAQQVDLSEVTWDDVLRALAP